MRLLIAVFHHPAERFSLRAVKALLHSLLPVTEIRQFSTILNEVSDGRILPFRQYILRRLGYNFHIDFLRAHNAELRTHLTSERPGQRITQPKGREIVT
jgi:hypothetical protein